MEKLALKMHPKTATTLIRVNPPLIHEGCEKRRFESSLELGWHFRGATLRELPGGSQSPTSQVDHFHFPLGSSLHAADVTRKASRPATRPWRALLTLPSLWFLRLHLTLGRIDQLDSAVYDTSHPLTHHFANATGPRSCAVEAASPRQELEHLFVDFGTKL